MKRAVFLDSPFCVIWMVIRQTQSFKFGHKSNFLREAKKDCNGSSLESQFI